MWHNRRERSESRCSHRILVHSEGEGATAATTQQKCGTTEVEKVQEVVLICPPKLDQTEEEEVGGRGCYVGNHVLQWCRVLKVEVQELVLIAFLDREAVPEVWHNKIKVPLQIERVLG